jgi:hypothetical protein
MDFAFCRIGPTTGVIARTAAASAPSWSGRVGILKIGMIWSPSILISALPVSDGSSSVDRG